MEESTSYQVPSPRRHMDRHTRISKRYICQNRYSHLSPRNFLRTRSDGHTSDLPPNLSWGLGYSAKPPHSLCRHSAHCACRSVHLPAPSSSYLMRRQASVSTNHLCLPFPSLACTKVAKHAPAALLVHAGQKGMRKTLGIICERPRQLGRPWQSCCQRHVFSRNVKTP